MFRLAASSLLIAAAGCRSGESSSTPARTVQDAKSAPASAPPAGRYGAVSNDSSYFVSYTPAPDPIPLNELFELTVSVSTANDRSLVLPGIELHADAAMPEHDHGMSTKPTVRANADGTFTVKGMLFHMPGRWELYLDVARAGVTERAQFEINLE